MDHATPNEDRLRLPVPDGYDRVLLHSCCAPCSGEVMEAMQASGLAITVYFYNPNIHPREEYDLRKEENIRFGRLIIRSKAKSSSGAATTRR